MGSKTGILLLNLGTPDSTDVGAVRRYLREFLSDPRVLDISGPGRWLLLNLVILPFRPKKSAHAYRKIWRDEGSPLKIYTRALTEELIASLGSEGKGDISVRFAMRYQSPSLDSVLAEFHREGVQRLVVFPLYPQYASSSTGSCLELLYKLAGRYWNTPALSVVPPFYEHPAYLDSLAEIAREALGDWQGFDHFLFSFHGLPERQVRKCDLSPPGRQHCLATADCCATMITANAYCYRAQSFATARGLAQRMGLRGDDYQVVFQSRLGRTPWIQPYTDEVLKQLPARGVKRLAIMTPSFTADCLETLEEIGIRAREDFLAAGGESLTLVPCLNAHPSWVTAVRTILKEQGV